MQNRYKEIMGSQLIEFVNEVDANVIRKVALKLQDTNDKAVLSASLAKSDKKHLIKILDLPKKSSKEGLIGVAKTANQNKVAPKGFFASIRSLFSGGK